MVAVRFGFYVWYGEERYSWSFILTSTLFTAC